MAVRLEFRAFFSLCENSSFKCGAGYQPAAALKAAFVSPMKSLLEAGCRLNSPPHFETPAEPVAVFTQTRQLGAISLPRYPHADAWGLMGDRRGDEPRPSGSGQAHKH
jgi:hypothetical protein